MLVCGLKNDIIWNERCLARGLLNKWNVGKEVKGWRVRGKRKDKKLVVGCGM